VSGTIVAFNCIVSSNSVTGAGDTNGFGGAANNSGTLELMKSTVSGNFASGSGGGIFNDGTVTLRMSTVGTNTAKGSNSGPGRGGGIAHPVGPVHVDQSTVALN